jgi:ketosteroid isomerase-like protein
VEKAEEVTDPKLTITDVKPLGSSAAREIGTFSVKAKGATPREVTGKYVVVWEKVGSDWKLATDSGMKANRYSRQGHFR